MNPYQASQAVHRLVFIISALCLALATGQAREAGDWPNVVVFFLDDNGYGDFAHHDNPTIRTDNIAKLAQEGMNFTQFSLICRLNKGLCFENCPRLVRPSTHLLSRVVAPNRGQ